MTTYVVEHRGYGIRRATNTIYFGLIVAERGYRIERINPDAGRPAAGFFYSVASARITIDCIIEGRSYTDAELPIVQATTDDQPMACQKCGRGRKLTPYNTEQWCGTCISREERRINTREMYGRGRRGY